MSWDWLSLDERDFLEVGELKSEVREGAGVRGGGRSPEIQRRVSPEARFLSGDGSEPTLPCSLDPRDGSVH